MRLSMKRRSSDAFLVGFLVLLLALAVGRWGFSSPSPAPVDRVDSIQSAQDNRCPPRHPLRAYDDTRLYYLPTHPKAFELPPPDRCFVSQRAAEERGFAPAATPAGARRVYTDYLISTEPVLRRQCDIAARRLGFAVPCPGLVPTPPATAVGREQVVCDRGLFYTNACTYRDTFLLEGRSFVFRATPTATRRVALGHFLVMAAREEHHPLPRDVLAPVRCGPQRPESRHTIAGSRAIVLRCRDERLGGPIMVLRWRRDGVVYEVATRGHRPANETLAVAIARSLELVAPH